MYGTRTFWVALLGIGLPLLLLSLALGISQVRSSPAGTQYSSAGVRASAAPPPARPTPSSAEEEALFAAVERGGVEGALAQLEAQFAKSAEVGSAHILVHALGRYAYSYYGGLAAAWPHCTMAFNAGCYHGLIAAAMPADSRAETLKELCAGVSGEAKDLTQNYSCAHGLGHGLMARGRYEVTAALASCAALGAELARQCYDGAFMEGLFLEIDAKDPTSHSALDHPAGVRYLHPEDPQYPCNVLPEAYKSGCYFELPATLMIGQNSGFAAAGVVCEAAGAYKTSCFYGLGRNARPLSGDRDEGAIAMCASLASGADLCMAGTERTFWDLPARGPAYCDKVPTSAKHGCGYAFGEVAAIVHPLPNDRALDCTKIAIELTEDCIRGAGLFPGATPRP